MDELISFSATRLAQAIRSRKLSSVEVVTAHLERIDKTNPKLNAVVQVAADTALRLAQEADTALAHGEIKGVLHGVPITIKDSFDTAGMISSWGTVGRAGFIPDQDATIVKRLKDAGAILMGKTNTPEFTLAHETDNAVYGQTCNPYDLSYSPGGSSGGAAAIIAAGGSPLDIGSDTGGSIRLPAHFCGIAGLKPTSGRVPRTGHAIPPGGLLDPLTSIGPLARFVDDLSLILPIIAGPDGHDPFITSVPLGDPQTVRLAGMRAVFYTDNGIQKPTPGTIVAVEKAAIAMNGAGMVVKEARPPGIEETMELMTDLFRGWDGGAWVRGLLRRAGTQERDTTLKSYLKAKMASPEEILRLFDRWDRFRRQMSSFFTAYDLIVSPVNATPAIPHGSFGEFYRGFSYPMTYNLTGWPGAVVRVGTSLDGLPLGVQLVAHPWREDVALAAAKYLETAFGGWRPPQL